MQAEKKRENCHAMPHIFLLADFARHDVCFLG
jgi:hypothetical protein